MEFSSVVYLNENFEKIISTIESLKKNNVKDIIIVNPSILDRKLSLQVHMHKCNLNYMPEQLIDGNFILLFSGETLENTEKSTFPTVYMSYKNETFHVKRILSMKDACMNFYIKTPSKLNLSRFNNENDIVISMIISKLLKSNNIHTCAMDIISNSTDRNLISDTYCFISDTRDIQFTMECIFNSLSFRPCNPKAWELLGDWWMLSGDQQKARAAYEASLFMLNEIKEKSIVFDTFSMNQEMIKEKINQTIGTEL
jgi:hypothetical protein